MPRARGIRRTTVWLSVCPISLPVQASLPPRSSLMSQLLRKTPTTVGTLSHKLLALAVLSPTASPPKLN